MTQLKVMVAAVVACGAATVLWLQHSRNEKLRRDNEVLRGAVAELDSIHRTRDPVVGSESLTRGQLDELLKLREEAARLGEQTNQISALVEANQKLAASLKVIQGSQRDASKKKGPEDALPQDIHPRDSWAFRGFATPEATLESAIWADVNGDAARSLEAYSPEEQPEMQKAMETMQRRMKDPHFAADEAEYATRSMSITEFRILDRRSVSDDEMVVTIYLAGRRVNGSGLDEDTVRSVLKKIDGQWKLSGGAPPGE